MPAKADKEYPASEFVQKGLPCWRDECGSSDAVAQYINLDGSGFREKCFSCDHHRFLDEGRSPERTTRKVTPTASPMVDLKELGGTPRAIQPRHLTQETCRKWGYLCRVNGSSKQQLAIYRDKAGTPVGVKIRDTGEDGTKKEFAWVGKAEGNLWGRHLWGSGGKTLVITEGEIDAMSVSQAQDHQWPVVSVPNGAAEASKAISKNLEWINTFEKVIIGFDMDSPGREAAKAVAEMLPAGKAFIVKWTSKDANQMLVDGNGADITKCLWRAESYRPDGILDICDIDMTPPTLGLPWPWKALTDWTLGRRGGEVYTIGSGSGMGKTDFLAEVIASTIRGATREGQTFKPEGFAIFAYEAGPGQTKQAILGKLAAKRFQFPQGHPDCLWEPKDLEDATEELYRLRTNGGHCFILDSKGAADWERVKDMARFLHHSEGVTNFMVDPISAVVAGEEDERKMLDALTLEAAALSVELHSKVYLVSHLTRPGGGESHEEGARVKLSQFRGSNGIGMYSNFVLGLERNQQADTPEERCTTTIRSVKDRLTGNSTGETFKLMYDRMTGTLDRAFEDQPQGMSAEDEALMP